jgi:hypothetical protein
MQEVAGVDKHRINPSLNKALEPKHYFYLYETTTHEFPAIVEVVAMMIKSEKNR